MENQVSTAMQMAAEQMRARERFIYEDCVSIGPGQSAVEGWHEDFPSLGNQDELFLFNVRSRATAGLGYCNLDSPSLFDVGYLCKSIGVQFEAPPVNTWQDQGGLPAPANAYMATFQELLEDCSIEFYLNQDQKLALACPLAPAGHGAFGDIGPVQNGGDTVSNFTTAGTFTNGIPDADNRWKFSKPIEIPRNHNVRAVLKFSEFAKDTLKNWANCPGYMQLKSGAVSGDGWVPGVVNLRVSIDGERLVQLRNAQTYR